MSLQEPQPAPTGRPSSPADAGRLADIFDRFYPRVFAYCVCRLFRRESAEDAAAQAFLRLVGEFDSLRDRDDSAVFAWLYAAANSIVTNMIRTGTRRHEILRAVAGQLAHPPDDDPAGRMDWPVLYQAVLDLKPKQQAVVVLRFFEGMDAEQIGKTLRIRPGTVRVLLSRAINNLKRKLEKPLGT